jgi:class 3 adenylate cyclase
VEAKARGAGAERERRSEHFESVRRHLERFKGREVKTTSTRMLATFEGSAQALYCAADICRLAQSDGLVVRVGVHVGEVEPVEGGIYGPAVAEVEAILAAAAPDEILVSETTRVLAMTAGLTFTERGGLYAYVAPNA